MQQDRFYFKTFLILVLALSACGSSINLPLPEIYKNQYSQRDSAEFIDSLKITSQEIETYRTILNVKVSQGSQSSYFRYAIAFKKPDSLRVDILPDQGAFTLAIMLVNNGGVVFIDAMEKTFVKGFVGEGLLKKNLGIPLNEDELMAYLVGRVPDSFPLNSQEVDVFYDAEDRIQMINKQATKFLEFQLDESEKNKSSLRFFQHREMNKNSGGDKKDAELQITFNNYQSIISADQKKIFYPESFEIKILDHNAVVTFTQMPKSINSVLPPSLFSLRIPSSYTPQ